MSRIESLVILSVTSLYFSVMTGRKGTYYFVLDPVLCQMDLKESGLVPIGSETVCELGTVVSLETFDGEGKGFDQMFQEESGGIGIVFLEGFHKTPAGELIDCCVLKEILTYCLVDQTYSRDEFHVNLDTLTGVKHLFIGLGDILGIRRFHRHQALFP